MKTMEHRAASLTGLILLLLVAGTNLLAQEPTIEMDPERATAEVAPLGVTLGGMPPLDPLALVEDVLESEIARTEQATVILPVPALPRDMVGETVSFGGEQVFFNATLGGGSVNTVLGSINVFRIGDGPEFRIGYDHRASDGFNFKDAGSGYFRQQNELETWVRLGGEERLGLEVELGYGDERFGLQQRPRFYSAETRELSGSVSARYRWDNRSSTSLSLNLKDLSRVLAVSAAIDDDALPVEGRRERYYHVEPVLSARMEWPRFALTAAMDYSGRFADGVDFGSTSTGGVSLRVEGVPLVGLTLYGAGATRYRIDDRAYFPVELGLEYSFRDSWMLRLSGGYRVREQSYGNLWRDYPVAAVPEETETAPPIDQILFGEGELSLGIIPGYVQLGIGGGWFAHSDRLIPGFYESEDAVYPVRTGSFERIFTRAGLTMTPTERITAGLEWRAEWSDRDTGAPENSAAVSLRSDWRRLSTEVTAEMAIDESGSSVPLLGGLLRYGIARDVELRIFFSDVLAPLEEDGRTRRGLAPSDSDPFIEPGFEAGAAVRVSF
ncbi:MAG: hypothetical protein EA427_15525 [Spirochaetaceae bacterium]|nr:MAG: hypothetical protein EA427_15525 [Spirochaetaceae bacterium]